MLKIRDFARLAEVSMATLRYYDEIGLLKPIRVDPETGYRFYTMDQLPHLHRILAFKELGLELTQIARILDEDLSASALQGMLRLRQAQLQQQIQAEQEQLVRVEARLRFLESGSALPVHEVVLKAVKPITGVAIHLTRADLTHRGHWMNAIDAILKRYGVKPLDHPLVLHPEEKEEYALGSAEVVVPMQDRDVPALLTRSEGRLTRCELLAVPHMASTLHHGPLSLVMPAYQAIGTWMEHNGYTIVGPRRKICLRWGAHHQDALTEIQFPVEKAA